MTRTAIKYHRLTFGGRCFHIHCFPQRRRTVCLSPDLVRQARREISSRPAPRLVVYEDGGARTVAFYSDAVIAADVFGERIQAPRGVPRFEFSTLEEVQLLSTLSGYKVALMGKIERTPVRAGRVVCISDYSGLMQKEATGA